MGYDNSNYWATLHRKQGRTLATVGYPNLSERFNELKYQSEAETILAVMKSVTLSLRDRSRLRVLDVGAGTGYWSCLLQDFLETEGFDVDLSALDISPEALEGIREVLPKATLIQMDLKMVSPDLCRNGYDLVYSFYCLHHLPRLSDYLNATRFAARSVRPGGFLAIMDPMLSMPYSRFDTFEFRSYMGNGVPRHLYLLEDILHQEKLVRVSRHPAVSFLLNSSIEAKSKWMFGLCNRIWNWLQFVYRSEKRTGHLARFIRKLDGYCKRRNWGYSSSLCLFRKED